MAIRYKKYLLEKVEKAWKNAISCNNLTESLIRELDKQNLFKFPPKPQEFWLTGCKSSKLNPLDNELLRAFPSQERAENYIKTLKENGRNFQPIIHVRETQLEDEQND